MSKRIAPKTVFTSPVHFFAFGFGSGLSPKAPGTMGTLMAIPLYLLIADLSLPLYITFCFFTTAVGIYLCDTSSKLLNVHDHPGIVWDEFVGFFITMIGFSVSWQNILLGFILFRFFDIVKPWPIKIIDAKVDGGLGIMLDDIIAGLFAWLCLYGINRFDGVEQLWF